MATALGTARSGAPPLRLFISYAHEDEHLASRLTLLLEPLRREQLIVPWHDRAISPGTRWEDEILRELNDADIVILIVTPSYLKSMYSLETELKRSLERQKNSLVRIIPVIGRPCLWNKFPDLSSLQAVPKDGEPIEIDGQIRELLLIDAVNGIIKAAEEISAQKSEVSIRSEEPSPPVNERPEQAADHNDRSPEKAGPTKRFSGWWTAFAVMSMILIMIGAFTWKSRSGSTTESVSAKELLETGKELYKRKQYAAALPFLHQAETRGSGEADDYLGLMYFGGKGVAKDYKAAEKWFQKADGRGDSNGTNHLGILHETGSGVPLNYQTARELFQKADAAGNGDAMSNLGWMYFSGWGVSQDLDKAIEYFKKAADHRSGDGMNNIGWLYEKGIGVPKQDYQQALSWFKKGADLQSSLAMNSLGWMLVNGWGRPKDPRKAIEWFQKAADCDDALGSGMAMNNLGWIYENGFGVAADRVKALGWYQRAAAIGNSLAKLSTQRLIGS